MKNKKYKILVLSDMKQSMDTLLDSAISLAKIIHGEITFFHVKNPSDVVKKESQLSAIRSINHEHVLTDKKIKKTLKPFSDEYEMDIDYSFSFGHVKNEVSSFVQKYRPNIIVLGKRKSTPFSLMGDNITNSLLKEYEGPLLIVGDENRLQPKKEIALGILNGLENINIEFADNLLAHSKKPLKVFKIAEKSIKAETTTASGTKIITYVFEGGDSSVKNISNYLSKNKIDLLYIDRITNNPEKLDIKNVLSDISISLLISGTTKILSP